MIPECGRPASGTEITEAQTEGTEHGNQGASAGSNFRSLSFLPNHVRGAQFGARFSLKAAIPSFASADLRVAR